MAEAGGLETQLCLPSATVLSANRVAAGIARSGARTEVLAAAGRFLSNEHGPGRAGNAAAIRAPRSTASGTRGQRA